MNDNDDFREFQRKIMEAVRSGQIPIRGQIQREPDRDDSAYQIRGCGNPKCKLCNAHIPDEVAKDMPIDSAQRRAYYETAARRRETDIYENYQRERARYESGLDPYPSPTYKAPPKLTPAEQSEYDELLEGFESDLITAPDQSFDDIVGNEEALASLRNALTARYDQAELYAHYDLPEPKGALLSGPPGCGKTMFARAAAYELRKRNPAADKFLSFGGAGLQSPFVGMTERKIEAMFRFAQLWKKLHDAPLLIFIDEAEVLFPVRGPRTPDWSKSTVATLLAQMDGIEESGAFVLLASNQPEQIDSAVLRDGRCDFKITVARPNREAAQTILERQLATVPLHEVELSDAVFAAVEAFYSPHYVIQPATAFEFKGDTPTGRVDHRGFLLEHIISGAMLTGLARRVKLRAFERDRALGTVTGATTQDITDAVAEIFAENKDLDHSFAMREFTAAWDADLKKKGAN